MVKLADLKQGLRSLTPDEDTDFHSTIIGSFKIQFSYQWTQSTHNQQLESITQIPVKPFWSPGKESPTPRNPCWLQLSPPAGLDSASKTPKHQPPGSPQRPPVATNRQGSQAKIQCPSKQNHENVNPAKQTVGLVRTFFFLSLERIFWEVCLYYPLLVSTVHFPPPPGDAKESGRGPNREPVSTTTHGEPGRFSVKGDLTASWESNIHNKRRFFLPASPRPC